MTSKATPIMSSSLTLQASPVQEVLKDKNLLQRILVNLIGKEVFKVGPVSKLWSQVNMTARFPFHSVKDTESAARMFQVLGRNVALLKEPHMFGGRTPVMEALRSRGDFDLVSFFLSQGASFPEDIEYYVNSLHFDYPIMSLGLREARFKEAKTDQTKLEALQKILDDACDKGNMDGIRWVMQKHKESGIKTSMALFLPLERAILGGFDEIVVQLLKWIDPRTLSESQKKEAIDLCIEMGYPDLLLILMQYGFPISSEQKEQIGKLAEAMKAAHPAKEEGKERDSSSSAPPPINPTHSQFHGGSANEEIYQREYRMAVAYARHYIKRENPSFRKLIENLGHRRRRMAVLGHLSPLHFFGTPQPKTMKMRTPYGKTYAKYGERINQKYAKLPLQVQANINGKEIPLTIIEDTDWIHIAGLYRDEILDEIDRLCKELHSLYYISDGARELAFDIGAILWLLAHGAPFMRGTPTIVSILHDILWYDKDYTPPPKNEDLTCEALTHRFSGEFQRWMSDRKDLPKATISNLG